MGLFIYYVRKIFWKINISYPLIRTGLCAYQGVRNVIFWLTYSLLIIFHLQAHFRCSHLWILENLCFRKDYRTVVSRKSVSGTMFFLFCISPYSSWMQRFTNFDPYVFVFSLNTVKYRSINVLYFLWWWRDYISQHLDQFLFFLPY